MGHRRKPVGQRRGGALAVAHAMWKDGRFDEAIRKFNEAVRDAPNEPGVLIEAARALGMSYWQCMRLVILPQAFRIVIPPIGNQLLPCKKIRRWSR